MASHDNLPHVSSPVIVLTQPTAAERLLISHKTHPEWGNALSLDGYVARDNHLLTTDFARNGGNAAWVLTDGSLKPDERPILASCETYRKRALVKVKDGSLSEVTAHGVASVFTFTEYRKRGYAAKMMELLGKTLEASQKKNDGDAAFSVLFSDIGKQFYAANGWKPFESAHLQFPLTSEEQVSSDAALTPITMADIPALAEQDEAIIRQKLSASDTSKTTVVLIPTASNLEWHLAREGFVCKTLFSRAPTVHGALYTPRGAPHSRVWVLWTRSFYGPTRPDKNALHIMRVVIEDETISDEILTAAIKGVIGLAKKEARDWTCGKVDLWNPSERVKRLAQAIEGLGAEYVVRENDGITSLRWFGPEEPRDLEWVANEFFGWC